ncbi:MAG: hypothetical protein GKR90_09185 [Pseudomonadales bacterium]|nr:hypothetical protein [Pseudomonadales bacterium]
MSQFEFVQVTVAVILGLGLTDLLRNLGEQFRHRQEFEIYWLQLIASCLLLTVILMYLWTFWRAVEVTWTLPMFLLQVASAIALALSAQFIKVDWSSDKSAEDQYYENRVATFLAWACGPLFASLFGFAAGLESLEARLFIVGFLLSLAVIKNRIFHTVVVTGLLLTVFVGFTSSQLVLE